MPSGFETDTAEMYAAGIRILDVVTQLKATATTMTNQLEAQLNDATFAGAAANAFGKSAQDGVHGLLNTDMTKLNAALDELRVRVGDAVTEYTGRDLDAQQEVRRSEQHAGAANALNWGGA